MSEQAINRFGVTVDLLRDHFVYKIDDKSRLTPDRAERLISRAAARVCSIVVRQRPDIDLDGLTEANNALTWTTLQAVVLDCVAPYLEHAVNPRNADTIKELRRVSEVSLRELASKPAKAGPALQDASPAVGSMYEDIDGDELDVQTSPDFGGRMTLNDW